MNQPAPNLPPRPVKKEDRAWKRYLGGCTILLGVGIALLGIVLYAKHRYI